MLRARRRDVRERVRLLLARLGRRQRARRRRHHRLRLGAAVRPVPPRVPLRRRRPLVDHDPGAAREGALHRAGASRRSATSCSSGRKRPLARFRARSGAAHASTRSSPRPRTRLFLRKLGFRAETGAWLARAHAPRARAAAARVRLLRARALGARPRKAPDGLTWNAIFSTRDLLRELPARCSTRAPVPLPARELIALARSSYARAADRACTPTRARARARAAARVSRAAARGRARTSAARSASSSREVARRSAVINRRDRITGDGVDYATDRLLRYRRRLSGGRLTRVIAEFVESPGSEPRRPRACARRAPARARRAPRARPPDRGRHRAASRAVAASAAFPLQRGRVGPLRL